LGKTLEKKEKEGRQIAQVSLLPVVFPQEF